MGTLSDLYKVHPAEDELLTELLVLGELLSNMV